MILNISQAAKRVQASRATLYKLKKEGKISFSVTPEGTPGIEESELARVFTSRYNTGVETSYKVQSKTPQERNKNTHQNNTQNLVEKVEFLQNKLNEKLEKDLAEMTQRAQDAENRLDELIKVTQEQSKQLLLTHQKTPGNIWKKIKNSVLKQK